MRKNRTKFAVLGMMLLGAETGYEIRSRLLDWVCHFWSESPGQIYPTLNRLVQDGLVEVAEDERESSGRQRVRYRVTQQGRTAFLDWLTVPIEPEPVRNELLLKIFFGEHLGIDECLQHLDRYERQLLTIQEQYSGGSADIDETASSDDQRFYWNLTLDLGKHIVNARLEWCAQTRRKLLQRRQAKHKGAE